MNIIFINIDFFNVTMLADVLKVCSVFLCFTITNKLNLKLYIIKMIKMIKGLLSTFKNNPIVPKLKIVIVIFIIK